MKIAINKITITARIRKEIVHIPELAADIEKNGLINPITVMPSDGAFQLLAGLRRLKAAQALGWTEIDVNAVAPADAEAALHIEYSENEQREPFTFSEKMDYAQLIEEIEQAKAKERMSLGGMGGIDQGVDCGPPLDKNKRRDIIGKKIGMSGRQYDRSKFVAENAPQDVIDALDRGETTIRSTYNELRTGVKQSEDAAMPTPQPAPRPSLRPLDTKSPTHHANLSKKDMEAIQKLRDYGALPPEGKIAELQRQLKEERARAAHAESALSRLQELNHNDVYHKDSIIESLKRQVSELDAALTAANARIKELEGSA
ncbi:MAG: ParB N-terminal domain-containing protein [Firmicutes bacterium]|nr:ParB N-terminal domain-containing protein [Bacillota bacterium]